MNARGYEQVDGVHYDEDTKSAPVTNDITIRIVLTLLVMAGWCAHVVGVQGAFLNGPFADGEVLYMAVPEGFEQHYGCDVVLRLKRTIYGLKQAAYAFWIELMKAFESLQYSRRIHASTTSGAKKGWFCGSHGLTIAWLRDQSQL